MITFRTAIHAVAAASLLAAAISLPAAPAAAYEASAEQRAACTPDVFRLCASEIPSVSAIIICMKAKRPMLSKPCAAVFPR